MSNRVYNIMPVYYANSQPIVVPQNCNGYVAVNTGTTSVIINGITLLPAPAVGLTGQSYGVSGNEDEIFAGNNGSILVNIPAGGGQVLIIWKYYIKSCNV